MRKATKTIISLAVVLIAVLNFIVLAFAQDPFTAVAVGGFGGASGAGLFGSMASASGIDVVWNSQSPDEMNTLWNSIDSNSVYFTGTKHEATGIDTDIYDYIEVDLADWLSAQTNFIAGFAQKYNVTDNSSGTITVDMSFDGVPLDVTIYNTKRSVYLDTNYVSGNNTYTFVNGNFRVVCNPSVRNGYWIPSFYYNGQLINTASETSYANNRTYAMVLVNTVTGVCLALMVSGNTYLDVQSNSIGNVIPQTNNTWTSGDVDTSVFDGWESAKIKIPDSISTLQSGWTLPDFLDELDRIWTGAGEDNIIIEDGGDVPPVPPQPIPDTPLGDVPFDDWVDLWGQSIWEQLTRLEEKQELMVVNQEAGLDSLDDLQGLGEDLIEDVDDLIGLETDINENLEDMITYEQGISEDVEDINDNVEDIDDEVIIIVDEMGNVIDVLEGIDAKIYAQGQTIGSISTEVGTVADAAEAIQTEVETQTETLAEVKEAVEDMVPYVAPLPDIASDTETMVDILPDIATATQTSTQTLTDTLPDIKDATETITETLPDIITEIQDATTTLTDEIPNIDDICLNIDEAPYKDLETGVDRLPRFMLPFITDLRSALGIWHYVTEWLAQISTTFAFISGCLVGTSIMTPIYAAIAGFMCIKIYRRMCN